jgi:hypothetical protein
MIEIKIIFILIIIFILYKLYYLNTDKSNNETIKELEFSESLNILKEDNIMQIIFIIKYEEYRIKYFKNKKTRMLFKNFLNKSDCSYLCQIIKKYYKEHIKYNNNNKQSKVLDNILLKQLLNEHKNNNIILKELTKAYNMYINILNRVLEFTQEKYKKKLYILTSDIICSYKGFYIPWHLDMPSKFLLKDPNKENIYIIPPTVKLKIDVDPNKENNLEYEKYLYNIQNFNNNKVYNEQLDIVPTNNMKHFKIDSSLDNDYYDNYTGGKGDPDAKISVIIYLNDSGKDFTGGNLLIGMNNKVVPKSGYITMFTGGPESYHMVEEVKSGERISFLIWLTDNENVKFKRNRIFNNEITYSN